MPPLRRRQVGSDVRPVGKAQTSTPFWVQVSEDRPRSRGSHPQNLVGDVRMDRNVMPDAGAVMSNKVMARGGQTYASCLTMCSWIYARW